MEGKQMKIEQGIARAIIELPSDIKVTHHGGRIWTNGITTQEAVQQMERLGNLILQEVMQWRQSKT